MCVHSSILIVEFLTDCRVPTLVLISLSLANVLTFSQGKFASFGSCIRPHFNVCLGRPFFFPSPGGFNQMPDFLVTLILFLSCMPSISLFPYSDLYFQFDVLLLPTGFLLGNCQIIWDVRSSQGICWQMIESGRNWMELLSISLSPAVGQMELNILKLILVERVFDIHFCFDVYGLGVFSCVSCFSKIRAFVCLYKCSLPLTSS